MGASRYGDFIRLGPGDRKVLEVVKRVPLGAGVAQGGISEDDLRNLLFRCPETLPIAAIDAAYAGVVPICKELRTLAGPIDALYVNALGRITIAEFKLWRSPEARREVIGQILDYTKELASWSYEDLKRQVSLALKETNTNLIKLVDPHSSGIDEAEFVDNLTRHLKRGEFLLLIVGDGIKEDADRIVDFLHRYSGLHFTLALVEAALYRDSANHLFVQPRVLARTEIVQRFVVEGDIVREFSEDDAEIQQDILSDQDEENLRFWSSVVQDYSFADTTVDVPAPSKESVLYVPVRGSGFGDWGLCFNGYLHRTNSKIGCYLTARKNQSQAVRIFDELLSGLDELRPESGEELDLWTNAQGRPRLGFWRQSSLSFLRGSESSNDYVESVSWMRDHLNRLVSVLHPRIRSMLDDEG